MALASGTKLGPYQILSPIGAGGMGEVYRARDVRLARDVAVKVLPPSFAADPDNLRRFGSEARSIGALSHPNILALYDVGDQDGLHFLVTELLEGTTLRERLDHGPMPVRRTIEIALQVAAGLAAAHDAGIIHRDLKPENIFLTRDDRAKILDFGLAKQSPVITRASSDALTMGSTTSGTDPGILVGTVGYMSPEQVKGQPAEPRSDVFAFGAVLYEMLSGQRVFKRDSSVETFSAILKEDPPELSSTAERPIPPALDRIIRRCLEKDPARRFQSTRDLAFALENLTGVSRSTTAMAAPRLPRRSWLLTAVAAVVLAAIAVPVALRLAAPMVPGYQQITYRRGSILGARFAPDSQTILYSAQWEGEPLQVQSSQIGKPDFRSLGLPPGAVASVSSQGELAMLLGCQGEMFNVCDGTLAVVPVAGGAPREVLEHVRDADWAPDGKQLAVVLHDAAAMRLEFPVGHELFRTPGWLASPRLSPDASAVAFVVHPGLDTDAGYVALATLDGKVAHLTQDYASVEGLAWNPHDGEIWFAASSRSGWANVLYAVNRQGRVRKIAAYPGIIRLFDISRDGSVLLSTEDWTSRVGAFFPGDSAEHSYAWLDATLVTDISSDARWLLFFEAGSATDTGLVYLRKTDGSTPVLLGAGMALSLSPDHKWALATTDFEGKQLQLLPTGAGEAIHLPDAGLTVRANAGASWSSDSRRFAFAAIEPGHNVRVYMEDIRERKPRPVTPDLQVPMFAVAGDGAIAVVPAGADRIHLLGQDGTDRGEVRGALSGEVPIRFAADGRLLVRSALQNGPMSVYAVNLASGQRTLWKKLGPEDRAGVSQQPSSGLVVTPDLKYYAYTYGALISQLFVARNLR